jgi:hypothetical protein
VERKFRASGSEQIGSVLPKSLHRPLYWTLFPPVPIGQIDAPQQTPIDVTTGNLRWRRASPPQAFPFESAFSSYTHIVVSNLKTSIALATMLAAVQGCGTISDSQTGGAQTAEVKEQEAVTLVISGMT